LSLKHNNLCIELADLLDLLRLDILHLLLLGHSPFFDLGKLLAKLLVTLLSELQLGCKVRRLLAQLFLGKHLNLLALLIDHLNLTELVVKLQLESVPLRLLGLSLSPLKAQLLLGCLNDCLQLRVLLQLFVDLHLFFGKVVEVCLVHSAEKLMRFVKNGRLEEVSDCFRAEWDVSRAV